MRHCLTYLVSLILLFSTFYFWIGESASSDPDFGTYDDAYFPEDDGILSSEETTGWLEGDEGWSSSNVEGNSDLFVDASSNNNQCFSDVDQFQMITSERLWGRELLCPNNLFQKPASSQDEGWAADVKFLQSLPIFSVNTFKEPDPSVCPDELLGGFIYPICGFSEVPAVASGVNINPCSPCTPPFSRK